MDTSLEQARPQYPGRRDSTLTVTIRMSQARQRPCCREVFLHVPPASSPSASSWSPGHRSGSYFSTPPKRDSNRPGPHNVTPSKADSRQAVSIDTLQVDNSGQSLGSSPTTQQVDNACQSMDVSATTQMELVDNTSQPQVALPPMQAQPVDNASQPRTAFPLIQTQAVDSTDQGQAALPTRQTVLANLRLSCHP